MRPHVHRPGVPRAARRSAAVRSRTAEMTSRARYHALGRGVVPPRAREVVQRRDQALPGGRRADVVLGERPELVLEDRPGQHELGRDVGRTASRIDPARPVPAPDPLEQEPAVVGRRPRLGHDRRDDPVGAEHVRVHLDRPEVGRREAARRGGRQQVRDPLRPIAGIPVVADEVGVGAVNRGVVRRDDEAARPGRTATGDPRTGCSPSTPPCPKRRHGSGRPSARRREPARGRGTGSRCARRRRRRRSSGSGSRSPRRRPGTPRSRGPCSAGRSR